MLTKHNPGPHPAFMDRYIDQLPDTDILTLLQEQPRELFNLVQKFSEEAAEKGYAKGKWSLKEVLGHLIDTERVFAYRSLAISRGETKSLPGFDENTYVQNGYFNQRTLASLLNEYKLVRQASLAFFETLTAETLEKVGTANNTPTSTKALVIVTAAHERHHLNILHERYLSLA